MLLLFAAALLFVELSVASNVGASIIGLYHYWDGDKVTVFIKEGRPFLKIEIAGFPDFPQCPGFQTYRRTPFSGRLEMTSLTPAEKFFYESKGMSVDKGTGFALWEPRQCLETIWGHPRDKKIPKKTLVQELDIYKEFFSHFTNKEELIRDFESGKFFLVVGFQVKAGYESALREVFYTYQNAVSGKVLIGN